MLCLSYHSSQKLAQSYSRSYSPLTIATSFLINRKFSHRLTIFVEAELSNFSPVRLFEIIESFALFDVTANSRINAKNGIHYQSDEISRLPISSFVLHNSTGTTYLLVESLIQQIEQNKHVKFAR